VRRIYTAIFMSAFAFSPVASMAALFGPNNYNECITSSMKGVTSDVAARAIVGSCRAQFPEKAPDSATSIELPPDAVSKITGRAGLEYNDTFSGNIYNGNSNFIISSVVIELVPKAKTKNPNYFDRFDRKEYNVDLYLMPLTNRRFSVSIDPAGHKDFDWNIVKARGFKR
jgi:hypothetical protein